MNEYEFYHVVNSEGIIQNVFEAIKTNFVVGVNIDQAERNTLCFSVLDQSGIDPYFWEFKVESDAVRAMNQIIEGSVKIII